MTLRRFIALMLMAPMLLWANAANAAVTITFYSHEFGSHWPHAFFIMKGKLDKDGTPVNANYGFTAVNMGPNVLFGSTKGTLDVAKPKYIEQSDAHFRMELTDEQAEKVLATVEKWRNAEYNLGKANCVHFIAAVLGSVGMKHNAKSKYWKKPTSFLKEVTDLNRAKLTEAQILFRG